MVRVFLALIGASAAWAQVTGVSPAVIITETTQGRQRDGSFQNLENRAPLSQSIAVTATGAWTATVSGPATTQGDFGGSMLSISPANGSGNGPILVTFGGCFTQPAGKYSAKITIVTQVVPVLIQITPRTDLTRFLTSPAGCSNSSQRFPYNDNCPLPTAGASALTSAGTSYTSTTHGSRWTRMTATGNTTIYSARLAARGDYYLYASTSTGQTFIANIYTGATVGTSLPGGGESVMSQLAADPDTTYGSSGEFVGNIPSLMVARERRNPHKQGLW